MNYLFQFVVILLLFFIGIVLYYTHKVEKKGDVYVYPTWENSYPRRIYDNWFFSRPVRYYSRRHYRPHRRPHYRPHHRRPHHRPHHRRPPSGPSGPSGPKGPSGPSGPSGSKKK